MGLRAAEVAAASLSLATRNYATRIDYVNLRLRSQQGEELDVRFDLAAGIGIVTGGNGAGKTTLLRALRSIADVENAAWPERLLAVDAGGSSAGAEWRVGLTRDANGMPTLAVLEGAVPPTAFVDPAEESQQIRHHFERDPNVRDLLQGVDPAPFDDVWLDHASRILRRRYDSILSREVEGLGDDDVVPWFEIAAMGTSYDILTAGRGELSALYLLWRLSQVPENSLVFLDEPDAWLAAYSQARLKETITYLSVHHGIHFVLTTHSPDMYLGLPSARVTVVEALPVPQVFGPLSAVAAAHALGAPMRPSIALLTEDSMAAVLTQSILRNRDAVLLEAVEVFHAQNGESALRQVEREFLGDHRHRKLAILVVLDGDQRVRNGAKRSKKDTGTYLPGDDAPDAVLRDVTDKQLATLSDVELQALGIANVTQFRLAISRASGSDHHDWFVEVAASFPSHSAACDVLVRICERDEGFSNDMNSLVTSIRSQLAVSGLQAW